MNTKKKICHLTSAHPRNDIRIFVKECKSLSTFYDVSLIVADGKGDEIVDNICIYDVGKNIGGRFKRFTKTTKLIYEKAQLLNADLYHIHDPELIRTAIKLKQKKKKIIYDVHEDLPRQLLSKPYITKWGRPVLAFFIEQFENYYAKKFNYIIAATPFIAERFKKINQHTTTVNNYPLLNELHNDNVIWKNKLNEICYAGSIIENRGIYEIVEALEYCKNTTLNLAGDYSGSELYLEKIKKLKSWSKVKFYGHVDRTTLKKIFASSKAGLIIFYNEPNHINAQPNKMFEYMSAGIPVICSYFPLWKSIIEKNKCGICVNPLNSKEIANAIIFLINNNDLACEMGKNGRNAVEKEYNWNIEVNKLFNVYKNLFS